MAPFTGHLGDIALFKLSPLVFGSTFGISANIKCVYIINYIYINICT